MFTTVNAIYSPESIAFQNDAFKKSLMSIFDQYRAGDPKKVSTDLEIALGKCIKDYTNMNVVVEVGDYATQISPPRIDKNSPALEGYGWKEGSLSKSSLAEIRKNQSKEVRALLDPQASYVHGYFADLEPVTMQLNGSMIYGNNGKLYKLFDGRVYESGELAALVLHEVGHLWAMFDLMVRFRTTNQILSTTMRQLDNTEDHAKRELIIKEAGEALHLENIDAQDLSNKGGTTVYTILITNVARKNRSQSGVEGYDINSFEALADQFATRHGAGRDLVTVLDKLMLGSIYKRNWASYLYMEFVKVAVGAIGIGLMATGSGGLGMYFFTAMATMMLADSHNDWYDKTGARFKRIRNQLVEQLKDPNLNKDASERIRIDIDVIDELNTKYKDYTQFVGLVYDYLIPSGVNKRKQIEFQQSLEELASNKLFVYANRLKFAQ